MSELNCKVDIPDVQGLEPQELTVGRYFFLVCEGDWNKNFDFTQAQLVLNEKDKYSIKLFSLEARSVNKFEAKLTFYVAGEFNIQDLKLTDGKEELSLGAHNFKVKSVLPQQQAANNGAAIPPQKATTEPPKPFGYTIINLTWPMEYYLIFLAFIFTILSFWIRGLYLRRKFKKFKKTLSQYENIQTPENEFYKVVRKLEKQNYPNQDLARAAQIYILRKFQIPVIELSRSEFEKFFKVEYPELIDLRKTISNMLKNILYLQNIKNITETSAESEKAEHLKRSESFIKQFYEFIEKVERTMNRRRTL